MTVQIAGLEVTVDKKPFVEADIKSARTVLDRLQRTLESSEISSARISTKTEIL